MRLSFLTAVLSSIVSLSAFADVAEDALNDRATSLYQQVMSPFCPGRSLNDCPSGKAHELKDQMKAKLIDGVPEQAILTEVFATYGEQYRAVPQNEGFGRVAWLGPIVFLGVGLMVWLMVALRRRKSVGVASSASDIPTVSASQQARINDELARLE